MSGNDKQGSADRDGVLEHSDDKVRDLKRFHKTGAPPIAGEGSCKAARTAEDGAERQKAISSTPAGVKNLVIEY